MGSHGLNTQAPGDAFFFVFLGLGSFQFLPVLLCCIQAELSGTQTSRCRAIVDGIGNDAVYSQQGGIVTLGQQRSSVGFP